MNHKNILDLLKKEKIIFTLLLALIVYELFQLVRINLYPPTGFLDQDYAKILTHLIEVSKNKKILLPHWDYLTTGEFDCTTLIALPLYNLTENILRSFAFANIFNIILFVAIVWILLGRIDLEYKYRLLTVALLLGISDFDMLAYTNMLFINGGQYIYKVLIPLMLLILLISDSDTNKILYGVIFVVYAFLLFVSSVSSGIYVFICGLAPTIVTWAVVEFKKNDHEAKLGGYAKRDICVILTTLIITGVGVFLCSYWGISPNSSSMSMRFTTGYFSNIESVFDDFIGIFNPFYSEDIYAVSLQGISICLLWVIIAVLLLGLLYIKHAFGLFVQIDADTYQKGSRELFQTFAISVFIWNFLILFMTESSPRYQLIGMIPLTILGVLKLQDMIQKNIKTETPIFILSAVCICVVALNGYGDRAQKYYDDIDGWQAYDIDMSNCDKLIYKMNEYDAGTMFIVADSAQAELLRVMDGEHLYVTYDVKDNTVSAHDYYEIACDRSAFTDRNIIVIKENQLDTLPDYILANYKTIGKVQGFSLLFSETNPIDGVTLIDDDIETVDLPTTYGYMAWGNFDVNGYLTNGMAEISNGNDLVLVSPEFTLDSGIFLTLYYEATGEGTYLDIYKDYELVDSYELATSETSVSYNNSDGALYKFSVRNESGVDITVKEIIFN